MISLRFLLFSCEFSLYVCVCASVPARKKREADVEGRRGKREMGKGERGNMRKEEREEGVEEREADQGEIKRRKRQRSRGVNKEIVLGIAILWLQ